MEYLEDNKELSDLQVLRASIEAPEMFVYVVRRYEDAFMRKAKTVLRNEDDARDVVQDTFTKIFINAGKFKEEEGASFSSWAYRILMNTAFTKYQKSKRDRARSADLEPEAFEALPDTQMRQFEKLEVTDAVMIALAKLPEHFETVLRLSYLEGLPHEAIAKREGISVGAIKTRMHRAKHAFKKAVGEW
jgi:RNA polymerase sigma-70 factor (ECF subfamily)